MDRSNRLKGHLESNYSTFSERTRPESLDKWALLDTDGVSNGISSQEKSSSVVRLGLASQVDRLTCRNLITSPTWVIYLDKNKQSGQAVLQCQRNDAAPEGKQ